MNSICNLKSQSVRKLLQGGIKELLKSKVETPRLDAEVLLAYAMKGDRLQLYLGLEDIIDSESESLYKYLIAMRKEHKPVSYLTGHKEFMSLDFLVNENVLIPRPETEVLVETVCKSEEKQSRVLEIGTGSGAIAVSLAIYNPEWRFVATDLSMKALSVAKGNASLHGVEDRISFVRMNILSAFSLHSRFDWVVSNPPYIPTQDLASLPRGIRDYEPMIALDGGVDGLDVIRRVIAESCTVLKPGGRMAIEIGCGQDEKVQKIAERTGKYSYISFVGDYSGIPRVFCCTYRG